MKKFAYPQSYLLMIRRYLDEKKQRCFTYRGLRSWMYRQKEYRDLEWHTVERTIRKLVEDRLLERVELKKNQVIFCWTEAAERIVRITLESIYGNEQFR